MIDPALSNRLAHDIAGFMDGALSYADLSQKLIYRDQLEQVGYAWQGKVSGKMRFDVGTPFHERCEPVFRIRTGDET